MKLPTDLKLLSYIYETYYDEFARFKKKGQERSAKIFVPIDCAKIAAHFGVDPDIVFGRLYYHLEQKYGYKRADGSMVTFFSLKVGVTRSASTFPAWVCGGWTSGRTFEVQYKRLDLRVCRRRLVGLGRDFLRSL